MHPTSTLWGRGALCALACSAMAAQAQVETIFQPIGMDTALVFSHTSLAGAGGIDFSFSGGFSPMYPDTETHTVVLVFEWGPSALGPWSMSPDNVKSVPGGTTAFYSTHVYHGPEDAPFVRLQFYAGGLMTAAGSFSHVSVVPEPASALLLGLGLLPLAWRAGRRPSAALKSAGGCNRP